MKNVVYLLLLSFSFVSVEAQKNKVEDLLSEKEIWFEGSIMKSDGTELVGLVRYNDRTNVLAYQDGLNSQAFTAKSVLGFEFFDESLQVQRVFYSLEHEDDETGLKRHYFFELLKDLKSFAILSKRDPIKIKHTSSSIGYGSTSMPNPVTGVATSIRQTEVSQIETIYLMSEQGALQPYIKNTHKGKTHLLINDTEKTKAKNVEDKETLADFISTEAYAELEEYAKKNDLKFKRIEDLLRILSYYETILDK